MDIGINLSNWSSLFYYGMGEYYSFIQRDIFLSLLVTIIAIGIYLGSDRNMRVSLGFLLITDLFLGAILFSPVIMAHCIIGALIGAYVLWKNFYGD